MIQGVVEACNETDHSLMLLMNTADNALRPGGPRAGNRLYRRAIHGRHLDGIIIASI